MEAVLFYTFSSIAVISALTVILHPKPTRALLSLIVSMFALSALYVLQGAVFLGMVLLIVYAGAVLVLFLFVIMLQGIGATDIPTSKRFHPGFIQSAILVCTIFLGLLISTISASPSIPFKGADGSIDAIGKLLFGQYLLPFEMISLLLLLGVFAAVSLAKKEKEDA